LKNYKYNYERKESEDREKIKEKITGKNLKNNSFYKNEESNQSIKNRIQLNIDREINNLIKREFPKNTFDSFKLNEIHKKNHINVESSYFFNKKENECKYVKSNSKKKNQSQKENLPILAEIRKRACNIQNNKEKLKNKSCNHIISIDGSSNQN